MHKLYIDCETSGLDPANGAVLLTVGMIFEPVDGSEPQVFEAVVLPTPEQWAAASVEALRVNGITWDWLVSVGVSPERAADMVREWLDQFDLSITMHVGQNPNFDLLFLNTLPGMVEWGKLTNLIKVNNIELCYQLQKAGKLPWFKKNSKNISVNLGLEPEDDVHTAMGGARAAMQNYKGLCARMGIKP